MDENTIETKVEEQPISQQAKTDEKPAEETPQQIDWRKFKEARKREREAKEAAERKAQEESARAEALKAALEAMVNKPAPINQEQEEDEDARIQKKIDAALEKDRQKRREEDEARERNEIPQRLAQMYGDFDQVCSADNLDYLEYHYPEVARAFSNMPNNIQKWSDLYKAVKRFIPNNTSAEKEQKRAERNLSKPQAISKPGMTQSGDQAPQMLDDKRKMDNWKRMQQRMKGVG